MGNFSTKTEPFDSPIRKVNEATLHMGSGLGALDSRFHAPVHFCPLAEEAYSITSVYSMLNMVTIDSP